MMQPRDSQSFSLGRRWAVRLNVLIAIVSLLALVLMVNYLAARHFERLPLGRSDHAELSPLTKRVLAAVTNEVKVTVYFDPQDPLFEPVIGLLKEYRYVNNKLLVTPVDHVSEPGTALKIKADYKLNDLELEKNLIIFDGNGRRRIVTSSELSEIDIKPIMMGESKEAKRTHFKGELMFTSALLTVTSGRPLKAYFLQGHGEHRPDDDNNVVGYSRFATLLQENNIKWDTLTLLGSAEIPTDCHLLIVTGPRDGLLAEELEKIDRYLKQGGRLLALFNYHSAPRQLGLEKLLANWGVAVGHDLVVDAEYSLPGQAGKDLLVQTFSDHPIMAPMKQAKSVLYLVLPRSIGKIPSSGRVADSPQVEALAMTSAKGRIVTNFRNEAARPSPDDYIGTAPLIVAVEKGSIRGVQADRGSTRMIVAGESYFLGNQTIDQVGNREFATHALNWLLARNELLVELAPRPITEYKLVMTQSQLTTTRWVLMAGMPGIVLLAGLLVAVRRRK